MRVLRWSTINQLWQIIEVFAEASEQLSKNPIIQKNSGLSRRILPMRSNNGLQAEGIIGSSLANSLNIVFLEILMNPESWLHKSNVAQKISTV